MRYSTLKQIAAISLNELKTCQKSSLSISFQTVLSYFSTQTSAFWPIIEIIVTGGTKDGTRYAFPNQAL